MKRARPDTGTAVLFLTTRVRARDQDDWFKLAHLIIYLIGTNYLPLTISANGTGVLKWYVDGLYGVHQNMRGHSGGGLSMGTVFPISYSTKQKLNTRSPTESEIIGVNNFMLSIIWTRKFLNAQDYGATEKSSFMITRAGILMDKNGKSSSGKRKNILTYNIFCD